jgi:hypothetical protein
LVFILGIWNSMAILKTQDDENESGKIRLFNSWKIVVKLFINYLSSQMNNLFFITKKTVYAITSLSLLVLCGTQKKRNKQSYKYCERLEQLFCLVKETRQG